MYRLAERRLAQLANQSQQGLLAGNRIGLEKEGLRVQPDGRLGRGAHPPALGSALTHSQITTDFSEVLLELITSPVRGVEQALVQLDELHRFVAPRLGEELLWSASMPCHIGGPEEIPLGHYGNSNPGRMRHVYRSGLDWRYGRMMQVIAGVHFNFSLADDFWAWLQQQAGDRGSLRDFISAGYFGLMRNVLRYGWLVPYLFGASPAAGSGFLSGQPHALKRFDDQTWYLPHATSLRMSDIGYQNKKENKAGLNVSYNSLEEYIANLQWAIRTPHPPYVEIGVEVDGQYRQLNANVLQIENEYYSTMRPKQPLEDGEMPTLALRRRGVGYVELRSLDLAMDAPLGVELEQLRFLEAFLLFCVLADSPPVGPDARQAIDHNLEVVASRGREPGVRLVQGEREVPLRGWAEELCAHMQETCDLLDEGRGDRAYARSLEAQREKLRDPGLTPSARVLDAMRAAGTGHVEHGLALANAHREGLLARPLDAAREAALQSEADASLERQAQIEMSNDVSFADYLRRYFAQR